MRAVRERRPPRELATGQSGEREAEPAIGQSGEREAEPATGQSGERGYERDGRECMAREEQGIHRVTGGEAGRMRGDGQGESLLRGSLAVG